MIHKPNCENYYITTVGISSESQLHWKDFFHKNLLNFWTIAEFEADNEIEDNTAVLNKPTNLYKQNPVLNGHYIISESEDVLKSGYYEIPLSYDNVD